MSLDHIPTEFLGVHLVTFRVPHSQLLDGRILQALAVLPPDP